MMDDCGHGSLNLALVNEVCANLSHRIWAPPRTNRFVHYTSWESAKSIIAGKAIWLSDLLCMTDNNELVDGANSLKTYLDALYANGLDECSAIVMNDLMTAANEIIRCPTSGIHILSFTSGFDSNRHWLDYACGGSGLAMELRIRDALAESLRSHGGFAATAQIEYSESSKRRMMNQLVSVIHEVYNGGVRQPAHLSRKRWIDVLAYSISRLFLAAVALTKTPSHAWEKETRLLVIPDVSQVLPRPGTPPDYDRPILPLELGVHLDLTKVCFRVPPSTALRYRSLELLRRDSGLDFEIVDVCDR